MNASFQIGYDNLTINVPNFIDPCNVCINDLVLFFPFKERILRFMTTKVSPGLSK